MAKGVRGPAVKAPLTERRIKEIASLGRRKQRDRLGETIVEGDRAVRAALAAGVNARELIVSTSTADAAAGAGEALFAGRPAHVVSERIFEKISDVRTPQGVLLVVAFQRASANADEAARRAGPLAHDRLLVLDGVQDPGNVGALLRAAAWFGVGGVITGPGTADAYSPRVVRASMGGVWAVDLCEAADLAALLAQLQAAGVAIAAADMDGEPAGGWETTGPGALIVGSEAHGISEPIHALGPRRVTIPGRGDRRVVESLNAAAATAVLMARWTEAI